MSLKIEILERISNKIINENNIIKKFEINENIIKLFLEEMPFKNINLISSIFKSVRGFLELQTLSETAKKKLFKIEDVFYTFGGQILQGKNNNNCIEFEIRLILEKEDHETKKKLEEEIALKEKFQAQIEEKDNIIAEKDNMIEFLQKDRSEENDEQNQNIVFSDSSEEGKYSSFLRDNILETYKNEECILEPILKEGMKIKGMDRFGHQVFTRKADIDKMINSIGRENILNFDTTILEPTSGDGAFTVRILEERLDTIKENFELESLKAISTIYSIEYDAKTCWIQRNNLYTVLIRSYEKFLNDKEDKTKHPQWDELVRKIIFDNIIWGEFAATNHTEYKNYDTILGFDRSTNRPLCITKWSFKIDKKKKITYKKELIS